MNSSRFRYALEPVLLTRQWTLDSLLHALAEKSAQLHALAAEVERVQVAFQLASAEWRSTIAAQEAQSAQGFSMSMRYLGDLARQLREKTALLKEAAAVRDDLTAQVVTARRAVEAAEQHRDRMQNLFVQKRLSADFNLADDQWNTLHTGAASHGH